MSLIAVGAYLRTLREAQKLSRVQIAARVNTNEAQIVRIEQGEQETRGSLLVSLVRELKGSFQQISDLYDSADASAEDGRQLAADWLNLSAEQRDAYDALLEQSKLLTDDELRALVDEIRTAPDPAGLTRMLRELLRSLRGRG